MKWQIFVWTLDMVNKLHWKIGKAHGRSTSNKVCAGWFWQLGRILDSKTVSNTIRREKNQDLEKLVWKNTKGPWGSRYILAWSPIQTHNLGFVHPLAVLQNCPRGQPHSSSRTWSSHLRWGNKLVERKGVVKDLMFFLRAKEQETQSLQVINKGLRMFEVYHLQSCLLLYSRGKSQGKCQKLHPLTKPSCQNVFLPYPLLLSFQEVKMLASNRYFEVFLSGFSGEFKTSIKTTWSENGQAAIALAILPPEQ